MTQPGTIQRTGVEVAILEHQSDPNQSAVQMIVTVQGKVEDRGDALLMIADAWIQLMTEAGYDPDKSFHHMRTHGRLN